MALPNCAVKVLEQCQVSPPPSSAPTTSLPLTFFDIPWLLSSPSQPLFFYECPHSTSRFTTNILPNFKRSLSLTLQYFFPFSGRLKMPHPRHASPEIICSGDASVPLTVAESDGDFNHLCIHHPRKAHEFHSLVPKLESSSLLGVQVTIFPNSGVCLGLAYRHVVADGRTFDHFLKSWASILRFGFDSSLLSKLLPCFDRTLINEPIGVKDALLKQWRESKSFKEELIPISKKSKVTEEMVRETFVLSRKDMEKIKQWILCKWNNISGSCDLLLSPYVLTCAFLWVCIIKARGITLDGVDHHHTDDDQELENYHYFGFIAGGITRLNYPVPTNYFGNCVAFGRSKVTRRDILGEDGLVIAAKAIGDKIKELNEDVLGGAENWISDWKVLSGSDLHVTVSGSPKLALYGLDFGWGKPKKIEDISIDNTGAISLGGSRDMEGDMEIGLSLPTSEMENFRSNFTRGLRLLS